MIIAGRDNKGRLCCTDRRPDDVTLVVGDQAIQNSKISRKYLDANKFLDADFVQVEADAVASLEPGGRRTHVSTTGKIHLLASRLRTHVECPTCNKQVPEGTFEKHKKTCKRKCEKCTLEITEEVQHQEQCPETPKTCPTCKLTVANKKALIAHKKVAHKRTPSPTQGQSRWVCDVCSKICKSAQGLGNHKKSHVDQEDTPDGLERCGICGWKNKSLFPATRAQAFQTHMKTHAPGTQPMLGTQPGPGNTLVTQLGAGNTLGTNAGNKATSGNVDFLEYLKSQAAADRDSRKYELKLQNEREDRTQRALLQMAAIRTTGTARVEHERQPIKHLFQWSSHDVYLFVKEELEMPELAEQLDKQKVNGLDFKAHTEASEFNSTDFFAELTFGEPQPTSRDKQRLQRAVQAELERTPI